MSEPGELSLFAHRVRDLVKRPAVVAPPDLSVVEIARRLSREGVGSIVITIGGVPSGIVTDRDLRRKVVAEGRDANTTPASAIMSAPLVTLPPTAFAFEALLEMTKRRIRHIVVVDAGRAVGVVSSRDLLLLQSTHPVTVAREIARASSIDALVALSPRVTELVRELLADGGRVHDIAQLAAELNDRMVVRVLELVRGEQTLRTDQDNGLVYADPPPDGAERAATYFAALTERTIAGLVAAGFPPCPSGAMASNADWRQPVSVWDDYVRQWIGDPSPRHILAASMYFDLRCIAGDPDLASRLRQVIRSEAPRHARFIGLMARDVVDRRLPVTFFGGVGVHRSGPHRGAVDVKGAGCIQLVGAARVHALALGLGETNTIDRIRAAGDHGLYTTEEVVEITDAYEHLLRLRLARQLEQLAAGEAPDNYVDPEHLSHRDALLLRDALKTVGHVQAQLRERYATDFIPT